MKSICRKLLFLAAKQKEFFFNSFENSQNFSEAVKNIHILIYGFTQITTRKVNIFLQLHRNFQVIRI